MPIAEPWTPMVEDISIVLIPINDCYAMLFLVEILLLMSHYIKSSSHTDPCPTNFNRVNTICTCMKEREAAKQIRNIPVKKSCLKNVFRKRQDL